jgi:hypothetical protein
MSYVPRWPPASEQHTTEAPKGWSDAKWHLEASFRAGTSHVLLGRVYGVACEWCPEKFYAPTRAEAIELFREHEAAMYAEAEEAQ